MMVYFFVIALQKDADFFLYFQSPREVLVNRYRLQAADGSSTNLPAMLTWPGRVFLFVFVKISQVPVDDVLVLTARNE